MLTLALSRKLYEGLIIIVMKLPIYSKLLVDFESKPSPIVNLDERGISSPCVIISPKCLATSSSENEFTFWHTEILMKEKAGFLAVYLN